MADWKRPLKHLLGVFTYRLGLHRLLLRGRSVIVLFHRVIESGDPNPISCSAPEFEGFCRFFARYFEVIPLSELLDRLKKGRRVGRTLTITFDDGYLDNRTVAAPILRTHELPACFFVTTGFIGSDRVPWWDAQWGTPGPWMDWSHVNELVEMGFEVGAHTVNHVDLGKVDGREARAEIVDSGAHLEAALGRPVRLFSYPYGRRENLTEENRQIIREAGFECCLSGFGGRVRGDADPFRLNRWPVSRWYRSPYQLGWEILFGDA